jgi:hypothetical protein
MHGRLTGSRPRPVSARQYDQDKPAPRLIALYRCPRGGHEFEVSFSVDVETPRDWECRQHGIPAALLNGYRGPDPDEKKPPRTHYGVVLERRSIADLEALLEERLAELAASRPAPRKARPRAARSARNS